MLRIFGYGNTGDFRRAYSNGKISFQLFQRVWKGKLFDNKFEHEPIDPVKALVTPEKSLNNSY